MSKVSTRPEEGGEVHLFTGVCKFLLVLHLLEESLTFSPDPFLLKCGHMGECVREIERENIEKTER